MLEETELKAGKFGVIRSLLRALDGGAAAKAALDIVIDACSGMQVGGACLMCEACPKACPHHWTAGRHAALRNNAAGRHSLCPSRVHASSHCLCTALQNLREAIASYRGRIFYEANDARRQSLLQVWRTSDHVGLGWLVWLPSVCTAACWWLVRHALLLVGRVAANCTPAVPSPASAAVPPHTQVCLEYLERYFVLICFVSYVCGAHFPPGSPAALSFGEWLAARPELRSILERLLRYNPAAALALNRSPGALAASELGVGDGEWCEAGGRSR